MKLFAGLFTAFIIIIASGCTSMFDKQNVTGAEFAKSKTPDPVTLFRAVTLTDSPGLDRASTRLRPFEWKQDGLCRLGRVNRYDLISYLEFAVPNKAVPADFYALFDNGVYGPQDEFHGIDSIRIRIPVQTSSVYSYDTLRCRLVVMRGQRKDTLIIDTLAVDPLYASLISPYDTTRISSLDTASFLPLDTLSVTLPPGETILHGLLLSDSTRPLFYYLDSVLLAPRRSERNDSTLFALCLRLIPEAGRDSLITLSALTPPAITFYGRTVPVYHSGDSTQTYFGPMKTDSVRTFIHTLGYTTMLPVTDTVYSAHPVVSTLYFQADTALFHNALLRAGIPQAVFNVRRDSIFQSIISDSISILRARAVFPIDRALSFTENGQGLDLSVQCYLINSLGQAILDTLSSAIFNSQDTTFHSFSTATDTALIFPIDKYLAALTDPRYAGIVSLTFIIQPYHLASTYTSLNRAGRIVFQKKVKVDFDYLQR
ncbi:MAG: hypothetical protein V1913_07395 [Fibrobacterota bacterium]